MAGLPSASLVENARFNALVIVPNAVQGIFRRRRAAVAAATRANVDGQAVGLMAGMYRNHGGGPVWVRVIRDRALLLLAPADVHRALEGSPDPFASDPPAKRDGMVAFQPDALTITRGELWRNRRAFTEAVLETEKPLHGSGDRFVAVAGEEAARLIEGSRSEAGGTLAWEPWNRCLRRITRRVILGDAAADAEALSETLAEMMSEGNSMNGKTSALYPSFIARLGEYVAKAPDVSLASRFAEAPADERTKAVGQIPHWMFAAGDTLAINAFRALAAVHAHPDYRARVSAELAEAEAGVAGVQGLDFLEGCLEDAMRLWPTTTMLSRETLAETEWAGVSVPGGTQVLIPNTFLHRDRDRFEYADRFAPERWVDGSASREWSFNHFSRGPQGCPGAALTLLLGKAVLAAILREPELELESPKLDPSRPMPHMLDYFGIRFRVA